MHCPGHKTPAPLFGNFIAKPLKKPSRNPCQQRPGSCILLNMSSKPSKNIEIFDNPAPERDYTIRIEIPEFTCLCPKTGQPDFATFKLEYVPDKYCVELKSLKLYMWSFRDEGAFHEAVTNRILDDLVNACQPRFMRLSGVFNVRGGLYTTVSAEYRQAGWNSPAPISLA